MTLRLIIGAHGTPPHRRAHTLTHSFTTHSSRTLRRVRSADPARPSLPPSSRRIACAADDSQSHRAASARLSAERPQQGETSASAAWEFFFFRPLPTAPFASLLHFAHSFLIGAHRESHHRGRIAPRLWRRWRRALTPASSFAAVVDKLIGDSLKLGLVLLWSSIPLFIYLFISNEPFKAMDLRERVSVWALVAGSCRRGDKRERMFGSSDGHSRWVSALRAGAGRRVSRRFVWFILGWYQHFCPRRSCIL